MPKLSSLKLTPFIFIVFIVGMIFLFFGAKVPPTMLWIGINWSSFLTDLGLYIAVVVVLQFYYDMRMKHELITEVAESALSNSNVATSGISNFVNDTKKINYETMLTHSEEIIIGFVHSIRFVDDHVSELRNRVKEGKKTSILLANPNGHVVSYLTRIVHDSDLIKPEIKKNINKVGQINNEPGVKKKITMKYHDAILRYSFVHSIEGTWIKMYRNGLGMTTTPGIYIRNGSPLYDFYKKDIENLREGAQDVTFE